MKRRSIEERRINKDADLPYGIDVHNVVDAVEGLYDYWYEVGEWHLNTRMNTELSKLKSEVDNERQ